MTEFSLPEPLPILMVVDDEALLRAAVSRATRRDYDVVEAASAIEALEHLRNGIIPRILLVDMFMPQMNGIDFFVESMSLCPGAKRILMTGMADLDIVIDAINSGHVHYFIKKPFSLKELSTILDQMNKLDNLEKKNELLYLELKYSNKSLLKANKELEEHKELLRQSLDERSRELLLLVRELEGANAELRRRAIRDGLTGLYNHVNIKQRLEEEIARSRRYESPLSVLFMDIDHFKLYNDRLGHEVGDTVLCAVATFLLNGSEHVSPSRKSDIIGRYGGEEFVMILPETAMEGAYIRAERLRTGIMHINVPGASEQPLGFLSVSIGVASYPDNGTTMQEMLKSADDALYEAKDGGRNCVKRANKIT
ncbi:diguanylate cyclase [Myxococcota bacterium]|nr:diguanylate cyclase [Myxococcota bacterium]MBU1534082.1 diguanylate cyclase [Myxococcota bacterium]